MNDETLEKIYYACKIFIYVIACVLTIVASTIPLIGAFAIIIAIGNNECLSKKEQEFKKKYPLLLCLIYFIGLVLNVYIGSFLWMEVP